MKLGTRGQRGQHGQHGQRGTMALEMVILAPVLLLLFMFLLACGRYFQTSSLLESAARDGARSASQARSLPEAQTRVDEAVSTTMGQAIKSCKDSASGSITTGFVAGSPLSVEVTCTINYRDLGLLGLGGDTTITKRFTSSLDPYRGVRGDGS
ncbi:TadE/TadG family type IV pilus assembly protein [Kribbella pratensis]|uniref:TadE-like protein n=1 Tax=Kribbella pratensis TaxID=2512112 RepID=A0A4V3GHJ2_9ACTN|nr:TadE family protein [Kribbella pratensis]TDW76347.1 TadE-like protein [Kribbella pratensis]